MRFRLAALFAAMVLSVLAAPAAFAQTQFTIPEQTVPANTEVHSTSRTLPAGVTNLSASLTSSQWSTPALAGNLVLWGVQYSLDGGTTWGPGFCDNLSSNQIGGSTVNIPAWAYQTDVIGRFGKGGAKGFFAFGGGDMPPAGALVRLFAYSQVAIPLGVVITVSP